MGIERSTCVFAALGVVLVLALAAPLFAQAGVGQRDLKAREWTLTHIPDEIEKHFKKEQISLFAQISEDFKRLQVINNEMMQTVFVKSNVDRKLIAATTAEINKRALRLSANLALPEIEEKVKKKKADDARDDRSLKEGLLALDHSIMDFIANPLFKQPKVIDSQNALKARNDLNLIIRFSGQLKRTLSN